MDPGLGPGKNGVCDCLTKIFGDARHLGRQSVESSINCRFQGVDRCNIDLARITRRKKKSEFEGQPFIDHIARIGGGGNLLPRNRRRLVTPDGTANR